MLCGIRYHFGINYHVKICQRNLEKIGESKIVDKCRPLWNSTARGFCQQFFFDKKKEIVSNFQFIHLPIFVKPFLVFQMLHLPEQKSTLFFTLPYPLALLRNVVKDNPHSLAACLQLNSLRCHFSTTCLKLAGSSFFGLPNFTPRFLAAAMPCA